jgi:hypothetical protein
MDKAQKPSDSEQSFQIHRKPNYDTLKSNRSDAREQYVNTYIHRCAHTERQKACQKQIFLIFRTPKTYKSLRMPEPHFFRYHKIFSTTCIRKWMNHNLKLTNYVEQIHCCEYSSQLGILPTLHKMLTIYYHVHESPQLVNFLSQTNTINT